MIRSPRGALLLSLLFLLFGAQVRADSIVIDFEGGTAGSPVGSFYAALGITSSNAQFVNVPGFSQPSGLGFGGISGPGPSSPIIISFARSQALVTLTAIDLSGQGFLIRAYNAGGSLLGQAGYLSPGPANTPILFGLTGANDISYIELFQPLNTSGSPGGVVFDNLVISSPGTDPVPEPATIVLLGLGLSGTAVVRARRKRKARQRT